MFYRKGQALGSVDFAKLAELRAERPTKKKKTAKVEPEQDLRTDTERFADEAAEQARTELGLTQSTAEAEAETEPPKEYAPKGDWVAWAVSQGCDETEAEALTKVELIELYGGEE